MYRTLFGQAFDQLPESIKNLHRSSGSFSFHGECRVQRGEYWVSHMLARAAYLPPSGSVPIELNIQSQGDTEIWTRRFGAHCMQSSLEVKNGLLHESLGLARFVFELSVNQTHICWKIINISALGVPLPKCLIEHEILEYDHDGRYHFSVKISIRGVGLLVHYAGWLA